MAYFFFGGTTDAYLKDREAGSPLPNTVVTVADAVSGDVITDLKDASGTVTEQVSSDSYGELRFHAQVPVVTVTGPGGQTYTLTSSSALATGAMAGDAAASAVVLAQAAQTSADAAAANAEPLTVAGKRAVRRDELVLSLADRGAPADGVTSSSASLAALTSDARSVARFSNGSVRDGLPVIDLPVGRFRVTSTILRELDRGAVIRGRGKRATVLYADIGITMFDLHRVSQFALQDMTLVCGSGANPGITPWTDGLIEGSCAVLIRERSDDSATGVSTTDIVFERVQFVGWHTAVKTSGNQMGDNVAFRDCDWIDNFFDFDLANGQAVNWRVIGGEVLAWVNTGEAAYNARLASWSAGSVPLTAKAAQRRDPADAASATQNVTVRDGAVVRAKAGGGIHFTGTSFIVRKTRLLLAGLNTAAATSIAEVGVNVNLLPWTFDHCSCEIRQTLTAGGVAVAEFGDTYGYDRLALVRYERPHPAVGDLTQRAIVRFVSERATCQTSVDLVHVTNGVLVEWLDSRAFYQNSTAEPSVTAGLVTCITSAASTLGNLGKFVARDSTLLVRRKSAKGSDGSVWAAPPGQLDHLVRMDGTVPEAWAFDSPVRATDHTLIHGFPAAVMVIPIHNVDGTLTTATRRAWGPKEMRLRRVSIISDHTANHANAVYEFRDSGGGVIATLTVDWDGVAVVSNTNDGQKYDVCRKPWADVMRRIADGVVDVVPTTAATNVPGQIFVEYC